MSPDIKLISEIRPLFNHTDKYGQFKTECHKIPESTGVYIFRNQSEEIIYIGKAVNLKRRILQYFSASTTKKEKRTALLISSITVVNWITTATELHALLLEDRLIKKYWPEYNVKQKEYLKNKYLEITSNPFPTVRTAIKRKQKLNGEHYGPFPDEYFIIHLVDTIREAFPIRRCTENIPLRKCPNFSMDVCTGPCRKAISADAYQNLIEEVRGFLNGTEKKIIARLTYWMEELSRNKNTKKLQIFGIKSSSVKGI